MGVGMDIILCQDYRDKQLQCQALKTAKDEARISGFVIWLYSMDGFLRMTNQYLGQGTEVAKCYPGGRTVIKREI
jgi:hypothetical protein